MADEKNLIDDEATEMASPEEFKEVFDEVTPPQPEKEFDTNTLANIENFPEEEATPLPRTGLNVASIKDRAAAGLLDILALGYLYWGCLLGYNTLVWGELLRPFPKEGHAIIFHTIFTLLAFLYFFVSEGAFFTSLGKFFAVLSVRNREVGQASLLSIAIRNFLRPIDYLFLFFPTWVLLEKSSNKQRLGDFVAGTVVMKHYARAPQRVRVSGNSASATVRLLTGFIDLLFSAAFIGGLLLFIDYKRPIFSFLILLLTPLFYLLWHLMWEGLFQTTIGLWIFGCKLATEEGTPIGFTQAILRAFFKLFDTNPIGWLTLFLSNKNQRPSDLAAGTVVVYEKRSLHVLIGFAVALIAIIGVWLAGMQNPRSFITPFFKIDFLSKVFTINVGGGRSIPSTQGLFIKRFNFLESDRTAPRKNAEFKPGETILFSFDMTGFAVRNNEAWVQEDLIVRYPDNQIGFKQETIVDFHQLLKDPEIPLEIMNTLALPPNAQPGHYTLVLVLHDRFSDRHLTEQRTFLVTPP